jgi:hypothetical protein
MNRIESCPLAQGSPAVIDKAKGIASGRSMDTELHEADRPRPRPPLLATLLHRIEIAEGDTPEGRRCFWSAGNWLQICSTKGGPPIP